MAEKRKIVVKANYAMVQKLASAVALLAFAVIIVSGLRAEVSVYTITVRAAVVVIVVGLVSRIAVSILAAYEEMNSGQT